MEQTDFPVPHPTLISDFSPSLVNQIHSCQLRVGFLRDPVLSHWRRPNTYAALGLAAHAVTEATFKQREWPREPAERRDWLAALWEQEIQLQVAKLVDAWSPAQPPPVEEWPGYALTRVRTIRRAEKHFEKPRSVSLNPRPGSGVEIELRDPQSKLFGRADRIEHDGQSSCVVDLKTGLRQEEATEEQRRQLLLYAVLLERTQGQWPTSIDVENASGHRFSQPLVPEEAEAALEEALGAVESFNQAVGESNLLEIAEPAPDRCRWCDFRVVCAPFWEKLKSDWECRAAAGSLLDNGASLTGAFVTLAVESPVDLAGTRLHVAGLPALLPPAATRAAVTDWAGENTSEDIRARWFTKVRAW